MPRRPPRRLDGAEYDALLRGDLAAFAHLAFRTLYPRTPFLMNWHIEVIASRLAAVRDGRIRRLVINLPPRHLKSLLASVAFPAWVLGHDPSAEILCVSYAQDLAAKWSRDCRRIVASRWYRWLFPTRLAPAKQAMGEFETTARGWRRRCLDRPRRRPDRHRRSAEAGGGLVRCAPRERQRMVRPHPLQPPQRQGEKCDRPGHAPAARGRPDGPCA